jgi:hypothetical protein
MMNDFQLGRRAILRRLLGEVAAKRVIGKLTTMKMPMMPMVVICKLSRLAVHEVQSSPA